MTLSAPTVTEGAAFTLSRLLTPSALWKRSGVPRDLIYAAIKSGELAAYNAGSSKYPRFLVSPEDFQAWLNTRRVQGKK